MDNFLPPAYQAHTISKEVSLQQKQDLEQNRFEECIIHVDLGIAFGHQEARCSNLAKQYDKIFFRKGYNLSRDNGNNVIVQWDQPSLLGKYAPSQTEI